MKNERSFYFADFRGQMSTEAPDISRAWALRHGVRTLATGRLALAAKGILRASNAAKAERLSGQSRMDYARTSWKCCN
jgi:hypothetical protein